MPLERTEACSVPAANRSWDVSACQETRDTPDVASWAHHPIHWGWSTAALRWWCCSSTRCHGARTLQNRFYWPSSDSNSLETRRRCRLLIQDSIEETRTTAPLFCSPGECADDGRQGGEQQERARMELLLLRLQHRINGGWLLVAVVAAKCHQFGTRLSVWMIPYYVNSLSSHTGGGQSLIGISQDTRGHNL